MNERDGQGTQDGTKSGDNGDPKGSIKRPVIELPSPPPHRSPRPEASGTEWAQGVRAMMRAAMRKAWKVEREKERREVQEKAEREKAGRDVREKAAQEKATRAAQEAWEARKAKQEKANREKVAREKVAREAWEAEKTRRENTKQENAEREKTVWKEQNTEWKAKQKTKLRSGLLKEKWAQNSKKLEQEREQQQEQQRRQERELRKELEDMNSDKLLCRLILVLEQALNRRLEDSIRNDLEELYPPQIIGLLIRAQMLQQQKLPMKHLMELLNGALRVQNERRRAEGGQ